MPANWYNRFLQYWASAGNLQDPSPAQANAGWSYIGQAPPTVEQFNSVQQWNDQKDNWLYSQIANVINYDGTTVSDTNLLQLRTAIFGKFKEVLTGPRTYYVDINGSDVTGNGAIGTPWQTIQFAINFIINKIDLAGNTINIQLKTAGTYAAFNLFQRTNGVICVIGDRLNSKNYLVKNTNGVAVNTAYSAVLCVYGIAMEGTGGTVAYGTAGWGIVSQNGAYVQFQDVAFGPCTSGHIWCTQGGVASPGQDAVNYIIYGGAGVHFQSSNGGNLVGVGAICTIQNNPTFSQPFMYSGLGGLIQIWGNTVPTAWRVASGTCVGQRYLVNYNSLLITNGALANIPGTVAGVIDAATGGYNT